MPSGDSTNHDPDALLRVATGWPPVAMPPFGKKAEDARYVVESWALACGLLSPLR